MKQIKTLLFLAIVFVTSCSKKDNIEFQTKKGTVTESVYASGVVKSENQYTVYSTVNGVLQKIDIAVGQTVTQGQSLFEIESEKASLNTENARLAYQLSQESNRYTQDKISEMETKVQMAKDKLALDQSVYNRNKNIKQYNIISEVEYEKVELAYKNSKSNYEAALKQLSQLKTQLKNEQSRNTVNLKIAEKSQGDFIVKSAFSGELYDVFVKEGAMITPQTPLAIIGKKNSYLLELDVDENDMVRVKLGQIIEVTMDSYKGKVFEATVDKIYPIMDERSRTFKIEAHFVNTPPQLYPNLTAEANIIIQTKKDVLTIPKSYLIDEKYVLVNKDEKRKVKVGLNDYKNAEIIEGLKAGETIYQPK
ncbi:MAG TPA: efflux RND transporter periplasmic adaptor subunit [Flavobacterium sp.]|uniref:efflux RND transporter periplasmic adaptor subunit n=1 Tax=Flavobacterium sp. TaxID=239 RepID=UPI002BF84AFF|nr:efflux RND transporter periplasmic adaptor subunit [Flavobacterium sp.]HNP32451.1 efflux RND transporter periplasmic adaptor subunit [Flavobacterium sp.]